MMLAETSGWADVEYGLISVAGSLDQGKAGSDLWVTESPWMRNTLHTPLRQTAE